MSNSFGPFHLLGGLLGAAVGLVTYPVPHTLRAIWYLPKGTVAAARALFRENRIGPNLKGLAYFASPVAIIAIPPLMFLASAVYGMAVIAKHGSDGFFTPELVKQFVDDHKEAQKIVKVMIPKLWDYRPDQLPEGKEPFDIRLFQALRGLIVGVATTLIGATLMLLVGILFSPKLLWRLLTEFFRALFEQFFLAILLFVLGIPAIALIICAAPFAAVIACLAQGCRRGYQKGIAEGFGGMFSDVGNFADVLSKV